MEILLSLSIALFAGLMLSRVAKMLKLPAVTAYLVAGILIGPYVLGAIGVPGFGWECKILDEHRVPVPQGEVGELAVKGDGVMKCYYKNPTATAEILTEDGWLLTGDMARMDEDGFIYLVDRKKDVIITGGENLYPVQIENHIRAHAAVKDVAVIGISLEGIGNRHLQSVIANPDTEAVMICEINEDWAKDRYSSLPKTASDCIGCGVCEERCPYDLPIRQMLKNVEKVFGK